jgi:hypothetical protein
VSSRRKGEGIQRYFKPEATQNHSRFHTYKSVFVYKFCVIQGVRTKEYKGISSPKQRRRTQNLSAKTKAKGREDINHLSALKPKAYASVSTTCLPL